MLHNFQVGGGLEIYWVGYKWDVHQNLLVAFDSNCLRLSFINWSITADIFLTVFIQYSVI